MKMTTAIKALQGDDIDKAREAALAVRDELWQAMNGDRRSLTKNTHDAIDAVLDADIYDDEDFPMFWDPDQRVGYHVLVDSVTCVDDEG